MTDVPTPPAPDAGPPTSAGPPAAPAPSAESPRRPWTVLGRVTTAVWRQDWFAVTLEVGILVLGVFLGLQVNTWNADRAREAQEVKVLGELLVNLRSDSVEHAANQAFWQRVERSASTVVEGLDAQAPWADSMDVHYGWLLNSGISNLNTSTYETLTSTGLDLIRTDSVRTAIADHYTRVYDRLTQYDRDLGLDHTTTLVAPVVLKRIRITERWLRAEPLDYDALLDDLEFREMVRYKAATASWMAYVYDSPIRSTNRLRRMIEGELDRRGAR
ncbi:hypothetical protein [Rubrivirga sp. IMCC43871]|uniref:hypothetical protein n=1 Tax=Rubrivirga sp. IMCC43871 TaxID=3391575 RepID=UPI00398FC848